MKKLLCLFLGVLVSSSCSKRFDTEEELWAYVKDPEHGYFQKKTVNGYDFSLLYKPTDLLVAQELPKDLDKEAQAQKVRELREKYNKYLYLTLSISKDNKEVLSTAPKNRQEFGTMVNQLAFGMSDKVHLYTQKKDTLPLLDYIYPRMYGMGGATNILFVYPRDEKYLQDQNIHFALQDLGIYTGEVRFKIENDRIKKELKLNF